MKFTIYDLRFTIALGSNALVESFFTPHSALRTPHFK
jgi:hypothetical protein